jgi:hypothetical protein
LDCFAAAGARREIVGTVSRSTSENGSGGRNRRGWHLAAVLASDCSVPHPFLDLVARSDGAGRQ